MFTNLLSQLVGLMLAAVPAGQDQPLIASDQQGVTFKLLDDQGHTPRVYLFDTPQEADTSSSINYWRGTPEGGTSGVAVEFKGIRFLRADGAPDQLVVRLVGIRNELELTDTISVAALQSGKLQKFHFGPVQMGALGLVSGTTEADMELAYNAKDRTVTIPNISGKLSWKRLLRDAQEDSGGLTDVGGRVGVVESEGVVLKAPEE